MPLKCRFERVSTGAPVLHKVDPSLAKVPQNVPADAAPLSSPTLKTRKSKKAMSPALMDSPFISFRPFKSVSASPHTSCKTGAPRMLGAAPPKAQQLSSSPKPTRTMVAACMEMRSREASGQMLESAQLAETPTKWNRKMELERAKRLGVTTIKRPSKPMPATIEEELPTAASDWEALPSGTRLRVWWAGSDEYFECTILNWRVAIGDGGELFYTHRCLYDNGIFDHDLSKVDFEVIDVAHAWTFGDDDDAQSDEDEDEDEVVEQFSAPEDGDAELSPRRKWLLKQETKLLKYQEEIENADIATPMAKDEAELANGAGAKVVPRGRLALRRLRMPNNPTDKACVTPRLTSFRPGAEMGVADTFRGCDTVRIVNPSDVAISYRMMTGEIPAPSEGGLPTVPEQS